MGLFKWDKDISLVGREKEKKKPKKEKKTAEELATETRNKRLLDEEIEKSEEKFAALARGKLGNVSLLSGAPRNVSEAVGGRRSSGGGGAGSLLGGRGNSGTSGIVNTTRTNIRSNRSTK
jgi:hypothetical protein